jgi:hypothetical protein
MADRDAHWVHHRDLGNAVDFITIISLHFTAEKLIIFYFYKQGLQNQHGKVRMNQTDESSTWLYTIRVEIHWFSTFTNILSALRSDISYIEMVLQCFLIQPSSPVKQPERQSIKNS